MDQENQNQSQARKTAEDLKEANLAADKNGFEDFFIHELKKEFVAGLEEELQRDLTVFKEAVAAIDNPNDCEQMSHALKMGQVFDHTWSNYCEVLFEIARIHNAINHRGLSAEERRASAIEAFLDSLVNGASRGH